MATAKQQLIDLLDQYEELDLAQRQERIIKIEEQIGTEIQHERDVATITKLSRDIEYFLDNGGDYNSIEDRILRAPLVEDKDNYNMISIFEQYLNNVYKFAMFETFIGRRTLLDKDHIKRVIRKRLNREMENMPALMPAAVIREKEKLDLIPSEDRYMDLTFMSMVFYHDDIMTKQLKTKLFFDEKKRLEDEFNKTAVDNTNRNKKSRRVKKLALILTIAALVDFAVLSAVFARNPSLNSRHPSYEEDLDDNADELLVVTMLIGFIVFVAAAGSWVSLSNLKERLQLDEVHFKKLLKVLNSLNVIKGNTLDVDGLSQALEEYYAMAKNISNSDIEYRAIEMGIPIPSYLQHKTTVEDEIKNYSLRRNTPQE